LGKFLLRDLGEDSRKERNRGSLLVHQAALRGFVAADNRGLEAQRQSFLDFWNYADFSPSYVYVNRYGDRVGDSGDEMLNGVFSGLFSAMTS
jgi:hypothetical protein